MNGSAFLVLHFQNGVAHPNGVWGQKLHPQVQKNNSVENTRTALQRARSRGMQIIYVNIAYRRNAPELPAKTCGLYKDAKLLNACEIGSWGARVSKELSMACDTGIPPRADFICTMLASAAAPIQTKSAMKIRNGLTSSPIRPKAKAIACPMLAATCVATT